jgi:mono/diheme cytochrome c family protein
MIAHPEPGVVAAACSLRGSRVPRAVALASVLCFGTACVQSESIDPMMVQQKYRAYARNDFFLDGRAMRTPPPNTIPRERTVGPPELTTGANAKGEPVTVIPVPVTRALLETGRGKFNIICATCHGLAGDGNSLVATQMSLRPPPSLHSAHSVGHYYQVITAGYGLMAGYAAELSVEERWAVIAYLRALQRSQDARLADAPPDVRARLQKESP